jgi:ribosomal protein L16 Arg81 hydroxylase
LFLISERFGRKRWAIYPPTAKPPGLDFVGGRYSAPKPFRWFFEVYPFLKPEERPIELIQEPGEIIFVPSGWWHTVLNVTDTIAVTQNWIDKYLNFLLFF